MEYKLMGISCLILIILVLTWIKDGTILEYRISVDNGSTDGNSVSANLIVKPTDIDITAIADVCKQKLRETVG